MYLSELEKRWKGWSPEQRELLLEAAEAISVAERVRARCKPTQNRKEHRDLSRAAVAACRLALQISKQCPPPWSEGSEVGRLITGLLEYADGALEATLRDSPEDALCMARHRLDRLWAETPKHTGRVSWPLLVELAWLASPRKVRKRDVSTIRKRYASSRSDVRSVAADIWESNWNTIHLASRLAPERRRDALTATLSESLEGRA